MSTGAQKILSYTRATIIIIIFSSLDAHTRDGPAASQQDSRVAGSRGEWRCTILFWHRTICARCGGVYSSGQYLTCRIFFFLANPHCFLPCFIRKFHLLILISVSSSFTADQPRMVSQDRMQTTACYSFLVASARRRRKYRQFCLHKNVTVNQEAIGEAEGNVEKGS